MLYSGAWGKLIREKNRKSKISWHCPFKETTMFLHNNDGKPRQQFEKQNDDGPYRNDV